MDGDVLAVDELARGGFGVGVWGGGVGGGGEVLCDETETAVYSVCAR
jgi:hypothetical protein